MAGGAVARGLRAQGRPACPQPVRGQRFYVDPESHAKQQADRWWGDRPENAAEMYEIAAQPGTYLFSEWTVEAPEGTEGQAVGASQR